MQALSLLAFATLMTMAPALPAPIPPHQQLSYRLPSPPSATYHVTDTTRLTIGTPMGPMEGSGSSSFTFATTFTAEGEGLRVSGALTAFEAQGNSPLTGTTSISRNQAGVGDFELVLGPRGVGNVVTRVARGMGDDLPMWADPTEGMFPRLPAGEVRSGDTWTDTVTHSVAGDESVRVVSYTYTMAGEITVNGRRQLEVTFSGDVEVRLDPGGDFAGMTVTGTETGFFLWDADRGLVARAEVSRSYEGSAQVPGQGSISMKTTAVTRVRLGM